MDDVIGWNDKAVEERVLGVRAPVPSHRPPFCGLFAFLGPVGSCVVVNAGVNPPLQQKRSWIGRFRYALTDPLGSSCNRVGEVLTGAKRPGGDLMSKASKPGNNMTPATTTELPGSRNANSQRFSKKAEPGKRPGRIKTPERGVNPCDCPPNWYRPAAR